MSLAASLARGSYRDPVAKRKAKDLFWGSLTQSTVTLAYFAYPAVCVAALRLFPCSSLPGIGLVWDASLDVSCEADTDHVKTVVAWGVPAVVLGVVGIPAVASFTVWRRRAVLWRNNVKSKLGALHSCVPCPALPCLVPLRFCSALVDARTRLTRGRAAVCARWHGAQASSTSATTPGCGSGSWLSR